VTASVDKTAKIWDTSSGKGVQILEAGRELYNISFDADDQVLRTELGSLYFNMLSDPKLVAVTPATKNTYDQTLGLNNDRRWITLTSENVVWLPSEYRPSSSAVSGKVIGVGVGTGMVWMCSINI
jgi:hypothetical protein